MRGVLRKGAGADDENSRRFEHLINVPAAGLLEGTIVAEEGALIVGKGVAGDFTRCHCVAVDSCERDVDVVQGK